MDHPSGVAPKPQGALDLKLTRTKSAKNIFIILCQESRLSEAPLLGLPKGPMVALDQKVAQSKMLVKSDVYCCKKANFQKTTWCQFYKTFAVVIYEFS
jgi:hypothetical protein